MRLQGDEAKALRRYTKLANGHSTQAAARPLRDGTALQWLAIRTAIVSVRPSFAIRSRSARVKGW